MLGDKLKNLRKEKDLLQKDLANQLNLSQETISLYESNKREPDYKTLKNIADLFDVSVDYLLGRTDIKEPIQSIIKENSQKSSSNEESINTEDLSPESQEELRKYIKLLKMKDMQERNLEISDELTNSE